MQVFLSGPADKCMKCEDLFLRGDKIFNICQTSSTNLTNTGQLSKWKCEWMDSHQLTQVGLKELLEKMIDCRTRHQGCHVNGKV